MAQVCCGYSRPGSLSLLLGSFDLTRSMRQGYRVCWLSRLAASRGRTYDSTWPNCHQLGSESSLPTWGRPHTPKSGSSQLGSRRRNGSPGTARNSVPPTLAGKLLGPLADGLTDGEAESDQRHPWRRRRSLPRALVPPCPRAGNPFGDRRSSTEWTPPPGGIAMCHDGTEGIATLRGLTITGRRHPHGRG